MRQRSWARPLIVVGAALATAWGCGSEAPQGAGPATSPVEVTVTGKVTVKGKPATKGNVTFEPLDDRGMPTGSYSGPIGKDGTYSVTTMAGKNDATIANTGNPAAEGTYNKTTLDVQPGATRDFDLPLNP